MTSAPNKQGESRVIAQVGTRPHLVTVTTRDIRRKRTVVVEWRENGARRQWKATATVRRQAEAEARAYAKAKNAALVERARRRALNDDAPPAPLTWSQLVSAYITAEGRDWAPNTLRNVSARVKYFTLFYGGTTAAASASLATILEFRASLVALEHEATEINRITTTIKTIFAFGVRNDLLVSKVPLFVAKKIRAHQKRKIPAFSPEQVFKILAEMKPRGSVKQNDPQRPWRPWAISLLACLTSKRSKSQILPLRQDEIQWTRGGASIDWLASRNKQRTPQLQPMPRRAAALLRVVRWLLTQEGYAGPLMFPALPTGRVKVAGRPYSYTAVHHHLSEACVRAGVPRAHGQALHAYRRYAANALLTATGGNLKAAGQLLNDVDLGVISRDYVREGDGEQAAIAQVMPRPDKAPRVSTTKSTKTAVHRRAGSNHQVTNSEPTANASAQAEASEDVTV
jgi:site-specific recombinase XerD